MSKSPEYQEAQQALGSYLNNKEDFSAYELAKHLKTIRKSDKSIFRSYIAQIPIDVLGDVAMELPEKMLKDFIEHIPKNKLVEVIEDLESDDATDLLQDIEDIDEEKAQELFKSLDTKDQQEIALLKQYDENESGAYMQTEIFKAKSNETISHAIARYRDLKKQGELENIYQFFIVDDNNILLYKISLEDLILFDFDLSFIKVIKSGDEDSFKPIVAKDTDHIEDTIALVEYYDIATIPIVDEAGKLLGRITADDIHDIIQENATEQIYNLAGVDNEAEGEYTLTEVGRGRAIWLFINLFTATTASMIIGLFDQTIQSYVALAVLMPIVASMGGNAGTQALTVTVRQLALGDIDLKYAKYTIKKEVTISLVNGLIFATIMSLIAYFWFSNIMLGFVIALSMFINLLGAGFFGTVIPLTLKFFKIDPAVGSSVLLTAFTDVTGFFTFLGLAKILIVN